MITRILKAHKGAIYFSILKYVEIGLTALTTFFLAKKLGPSELGLAVPVLLYITYANYLALGLNQTITKNFSRISTADQPSFIALNIQFFAIMSVFNLILATSILDKSYSFLASSVSILIILRGLFSAYYRVVGRLTILNLCNIISSVILFVLVMIYVVTLQNYLFAWILSIVSAVMIFLQADKLFFRSVVNSLRKLPQRKVVFDNLSEGLKLAATGIITTLMITSDRFIVNRLNLDNAIMGVYQLGDYIGMALYMILTTVIFYFYPIWIKRIREDNIFRKLFLRNWAYLSFLIPIILLATFFTIEFLSQFVFLEFQNLTLVTTSIVYCKLSVILFSGVAVYCIGKDEEVRFLRFSVLPIAIIVCYGFYVLQTDVGSYLEVPSVVGTVILLCSILSLLMLRSSERRLKEN